MTEGDRQPVSLCSALSHVSQVSPWRLGSLLFPCQLGVFQVGSGHTGSMLAVCDSFLDGVQVSFWLIISPFLALSFLLAVLLLFCFSAG